MRASLAGGAGALESTRQPVDQPGADGHGADSGWQDPRLLAAVLATAVLAVHTLPRLPSLSVLLLLGLPLLWPWRARALWGAALLGLLVSVWNGQRYLDDRWPADRHGQARTVSGHVVSLPERAAGLSADAQGALRFEFRPLDPTLPQRIRASWYRDAQPLRGGECWTLDLRLRAPRGSLNPGAFDYEAWLYRRGVSAAATVRDGRRCDVRRWHPILHLRQGLTDRFDRWLADHPGRAMIAALSIGDTSGFSDHDWEVFRETGTTHLVAISGFNVAILAGFAFLLIRWTWPASTRLAASLPAHKAAMIGAALTGMAYGLLAGWESPAQRAALMLALLLCAALPDRHGAPSRVLALTLALMLLASPAAVLSPGLWLSFGAVAAIFYAAGGRLGLPPAWRTAVRLQLMLSLTLAPLTLYFFQGAAWLGLPANLIAVPLMTVLTPLVIAAIGLALILPGPGVMALTGVAQGLVWVQQGLGWVAEHAPAAWIPASPPAAALALALFGALLLFAPRGLPVRPLALLCLLPLLWPPRTEVPPPLQVTALDVGQGLSVLLRTPGHALLYDAGPAFPGGFDAGESVVAPHVLSQGLRGVDGLMLSHGDRDHAGGIPSVLGRLRVARQWGTPGQPPCVDGQRWTWDGVQFEVLHPDRADLSDNDRSCVLRVSAPGMSVLLAGDIERAAEARLLRDHRARLSADVLIAPHHGSRTSSTRAFVEAVSPRRVIFGAGWRSYYGHPHPQVTARYAAIGSQMRTTGVEGAVTLWLDGDGALQWRSWRRERSRFWNAPPLP